MSTNTEQLRSDNTDTLLRLEGVYKAFPGVVACNDVSLEIKKGEIVTLLGENGAGKTTLMSCVYGLYKISDGAIYWKGNKVDIRSSKDAIEMGIGMVHQHFMLVPPLTVAENVILGLPSGKGPLLNLEAAEDRINKLSDRYGFNLNPKSIIWQLPVGVQQRVEILKALYRNVDLLILDEPTAVLAPQQVAELFKVLKGLAQAGISIIFITHKLSEVMEISDRIAVMRDGRLLTTVRRDDTDDCEVTRLMVGRDVEMCLVKPDVNIGETAFSVRSLETLSDKGLPALNGLSFDIRRGEILGIAGVDGNGQKELAECITGLRPTTKGNVYLDNQDITDATPRELHELAVGHIPQDRQRTGLILDFSIEQNLVLKQFYTRPFSKYGFVNQKLILKNANTAIGKFDIRTTGPELKVASLSGGNQQKVILGRELSRDLKMLVAAHPTRGLDIGATEFVRKMMLDQCAKGTSVLLISSELDELMSMSDRVAVMFKGEIMGIVSPKEVGIAEVGLMMTGVRRQSCDD